MSSFLSPGGSLLAFLTTLLPRGGARLSRRLACSKTVGDREPAVAQKAHEVFLPPLRRLVEEFLGDEFF